ncbi:hypothetical protein C1752_13137 [Acaryochloris thomasi RCC1774]|uniref:Uncharacterized protein n=1 Tax=Acaryochloris thomasi RCC1774 TaxID=1764569 RepID=A0A2W1JMA6_9CYAN|nr:hypothetical protein [Acaryochloris thomasi]PZD70411.1 hypothetical protein C1752_13137 [Acaryochloris thomasi RCC1774]
MTGQTLEGTWEEVLTHAPELQGHRVRVIVLDLPEQQQTTSVQSEVEQRRKAFEVFMASTIPDAPLLSDEAISRENLYSSRG